MPRGGDERKDRKRGGTRQGPGSGEPQKKREEPSTQALHPSEVLALVCDYFCDEGLKATDIKKRLEEEHGVEITREEVYRLIRKAAGQGWIRFVPPQEYLLQRRLKEDRYPWLQDVSVVQAARFEDVAYRGAKMLLELLQQHYSGKVVHIGFSGGYALRSLARHFAQLLREQTEHMPETIVFHAMVAGFDVYEPTTDPNAFFTYFVKDAAMQVNTSFVGLHAPAMVETELFERLSKLGGIYEAYQHADEIDILVTSASCWKDEHCMLRRYMKLADQSAEELERAGCVGDMLWQPIGPDGPIEMKTVIRAMTIMDLSDVREFVARKNHVLLVAGPCGMCHRPKTEVVKAILNQKHQLVTHLVVDTRCGRDLLST
jgi:DNA-binding transcriptional regulator LsrR (DeoR family)